jgi:riboflavin biosynthesis pyrimidine reductase
VELLLHEGGPTLFGHFLAARLVDELFLTLAPQIAGRNGEHPRPGLVADAEFVPETAPWLTLVIAKQQQSHLYLRYRTTGEAVSPASALPNS